MRVIFGTNARFNIRDRGSSRLMTLNIRASRAEQARWSVGIWTRVVQYASGTLSEEKDGANILALMRDLGWTQPNESNAAGERRAFVTVIIKEAREVRSQIGEILCWIVNPGKNLERDRRAVEIISDHSHVVKLQLVDGRVVGRSFGGEHFLDSISRFVCDSLHQFSNNLARLPEPSPICLCKMPDCHQFFVRDGKHAFCQKHRGPKSFRSTDENRRYKFIRDNLRAPVYKLKKKIINGRVANARDGAWKLKCLMQIDVDRTKRIKKRPSEYLRIG